jgi:hypothetical protein
MIAPSLNMKRSRLKVVIFVLLLILIGGVALFAYGIVSGGRSMELVVGGKRVQGLVTRIEPLKTDHGSAPAPGHEGYYSIVSFSDDAGKTHEVRSLGSEGQPQYALGSNVPVLYLSERPQGAKINDNGSLWRAPMMSLIVSGLMFIGGCLLGFATGIEVLLIGVKPAQAPLPPP